MQAESNIDLITYLERAPNPDKNKIRYEWHLERYRFSKKFLKTPSRVADIGCGWGFGSDFLHKNGACVNGFDVNPHVIEYAKTIFNDPGITFDTHDILSEPIPGSPYDLICMFEVIEHLEDPDKGLDNINKSLGNDGKLILFAAQLNDITIELTSICSQEHMLIFSKQRCFSPEIIAYRYIR